MKLVERDLTGRLQQATINACYTFVLYIQDIIVKANIHNGSQVTFVYKTKL